VTAGAIAAELAALRSAGAELRSRPARQTVDALARILDGWRDPASPWRRALEGDLPRATGFSPPTVREGLARGLRSWSGDALRDLVEREIGPLEDLDGEAARTASGFAATSVLLAGSIPMPTILALLAPLLLRSPVLAKTASRDPLTARRVAASVAEVDEALGRCCRVVDFPGADESAMAALLAADCVVANGSDETVAAVAARVHPPRRLVSYGHRLSVSALAGPATEGGAVGGVAGAIALDLALWDQLGCLSPVAVYVVDPDGAGADRLAEALAQSPADAEERWPRGTIDPEAAASILRERAEAEVRAAAGRRVALHASASTAWTVVREDSAKLRPAPLHRFVRVHPVGDTAALLEALRPLGPHLAGVSMAGFGRSRPVVARALTDLGASYICPPGELQAPPLHWCRGGRGVLRPLARLAHVEPDGD
jgi:hypothetical protein